MKHGRLPSLARSSALVALLIPLVLSACGDSGSEGESNTGGFSSIGGSPGDGGSPTSGGSGGSGGGVSGGEGGLGGVAGSPASESGGSDSGKCPPSLPEGECEPGDTLACNGWLYPFVSVYCSCDEMTETDSPQWSCWL